MNRTYEEWLKYYEDTTKEQVIEDMLLDIKKLKEELDSVNITKNSYVKLTNQVGELQQRIDKAIEYIKEEQERTDIDEVINTTKLLSILKGEDNE